MSLLVLFGRPYAEGILPQWFWSSVELTGNQTQMQGRNLQPRFWSSVELTGNQTGKRIHGEGGSFGAVSN